MERKSRMIASVMVLAVILFSVSCRKVFEHWPKGHGNGIACKIKKVIFPDFVKNYYYSSKGLLDSIIRVPEVGFYGTALTFFKYDHKNRLIEYAEYYERDPEFYVQIHHYKYQGNRIVQDTGFYQIAGVYTQVTDLEYDAFGRIIRETGIYWTEENPSLIEPTPEMKYAYNSDGNRYKIWFDGNLTTINDWDDKVNPLLTDPVLQFIGRGYSINNELPGPTSYNDKGLPLTYPEDELDPFSAIGYEYNCK
jgi:hypothetical protein